MADRPGGRRQRQPHAGGRGIRIPGDLFVEHGRYVAREILEVGARCRGSPRARRHTGADFLAVPHRSGAAGRRRSSARSSARSAWAPRRARPVRQGLNRARRLPRAYSCSLGKRALGADAGAGSNPGGRVLPGVAAGAPAAGVLFEERAMMDLSLGPIFSSFMRNRTGALLVVLQVAIALAVLVNSAWIVHQRIEALNRPTGLDEANIFVVSTAAFNEHFKYQASVQEDLAYLRSLPGV